MTEAALKSFNFIGICSIPSKFQMCMYERMKNVYAQNQSSIHCSCVWKVVHNRTLVFMQGQENRGICNEPLTPQIMHHTKDLLLQLWHHIKR